MSTKIIPNFGFSKLFRTVIWSALYLFGTILKSRFAKRWGDFRPEFYWNNEDSLGATMAFGDPEPAGENDLGATQASKFWKNG